MDGDSFLCLAVTRDYPLDTATVAEVSSHCLGRHAPGNQSSGPRPLGVRSGWVVNTSLHFGQDIPACCAGASAGFGAAFNFRSLSPPFSCALTSPATPANIARAIPSPIIWARVLIRDVFIFSSFFL